MDSLLLALDGVRKSFGGVRALANASLELHRGAVTALIGENGAGKSTLVKILSGVHQPDGGEIRIDGRAARIGSPLEARALGIGVVHQECQAFDNLSVAENLFVNAHPARRGLVSWRDVNARARAVLAELHADFDADAPASSLSIAQKHVVQIARALVDESRIVIFDEPTASLSQRECAELFRIVQQLRESGRAVLFISHKFEELDVVAQRYVVFRDGASVAQGLLAGTPRDELIRLMVGRELDLSAVEPAGKAGDELLRVEGLGRAGEFADVSFNLRRGEVLGIYGLVGAGRSELTQALFGITRADAGRVTGTRDIALVPEDRQTQGGILDFSVAANIALPNLAALAPRGWCSADREAALAQHWIGALGIRAQGPDQPVRALSGGNQQKVVLAKWLARKPEVLIFDEPTKGVDVGARAAVHAVTREFARAGHGVIMISSDLPEILALSDRVLVMRRGRLRGEFSRAEATSENLLRAASDA